MYMKSNLISTTRRKGFNVLHLTIGSDSVFVGRAIFLNHLLSLAVTI